MFIEKEPDITILLYHLVCKLAISFPTLQPMSWSELGSWLRILMQETSTIDIPDGLQGYMEDTHPYHEAVEIFRASNSVCIYMIEVS